MPAGDLLTCLLTVNNTGNVDLGNVTLMAPPSACFAYLLGGNSTSMSCQVSVTATQEDLQQGFVNLTTIWLATPQGLSDPSVQVQSRSELVYLKPAGRLQVDVMASPDRVNSSGGHLQVLVCIFGKQH